MTGSVRTQIFTSFALTMFVLYRQKREEKSLGFHETFFFLLKYIFFLAWRIYSFTRNNLAHYFFGLVSFFLVRFVLFFFCFFPSRLDKRTFPSWLPQEDYGFFFQQLDAWPMCVKQSGFGVAFYLCWRMHTTTTTSQYNICVQFLDCCYCRFDPSAMFSFTYYSLNAFLGSDQQSNKLEMGCFPFYFTRVANTNQ